MSNKSVLMEVLQLADQQLERDEVRRMARHSLPVARGPFATEAAISTAITNLFAQFPEHDVVGVCTNLRTDWAALRTMMGRNIGIERQVNCGFSPWHDITGEASYVATLAKLQEPVAGSLVDLLAKADGVLETRDRALTVSVGVWCSACSGSDSASCTD